MKKILSLALCIFISPVSFAQPLAAIMSFESMAVTDEGVKKQTFFQETFIRDTQSIWTQRIVPQPVKMLTNDEHHEHEHNLNFATAGKWITRAANNSTSLQFVRTNEKTIIIPRASDYGTLGFDGQWETAFYLIDRQALKTMTTLSTPAPAGSKWYEKKNSQEYTRILWSETLQLPLTIETGRFDNSQHNKITLTITTPPANMPWDNLKDYEQVAYEDLLD